jgi:hypothetical protein
VSEDGRIIALRFRRTDEAVTQLKFKSEDLPDIILHMENAVGIASDVQKNSLANDLEQSKVRTVERIQRRMTDESVPVISLFFNTGLRVDAAFNQHQLSEFINWLQTFQERLSRPSNFKAN